MAQSLEFPSLLKQAAVGFLMKFSNETVIRLVKDNAGVMGFETEYSFVSSVYRARTGLVCAHMKLIRLAVEKEKSLIIYISNCNKFFKFNPSEALCQGDIFHKPGFVVVYFDSSLGRVV